MHETEDDIVKRLMGLLRTSHRLLIQHRERDLVLYELSRAIVQEGGYPFAWLGWGETVEGVFHPVAQSCFGRYVNQECSALLADMLWEHALGRVAMHRGELLRGVILPGSIPVHRPERLSPFPLYNHDQLCGVLLVNLRGAYCSQREAELLSWLADDIAHALPICGDLHHHHVQAMELLESVPDAIVVVDLQGRILRINTQAESYFGYSREELLGAQVDLLMPEYMVEHPSGDAVVGEFCTAPMLTARRKDGTEFPVEVTLSTSRALGQATVIGVVRDVTRRREMEQALCTERAQLAQRVAEHTAELSRANAELGRAMRLKDEFLANMSHELRTPLNAILGFSEALLEGIYEHLSPAQRSCMVNITESSHHLLALINDVLDLAKVGAGRIPLEYTRIGVEEICQASLSMIKSQAAKKHIRLYCHCEPIQPELEADMRRLKQMLVNLLSNAVKFTPEDGSVTLIVEADPESHTVSFSVRDTGIGIAPEHLPELFRPFTQLDNTRKQTGGTGLGLALVAKMVELHGGSVSVESTPNLGSCFILTLPWHAPAGLTLDFSAAAPAAETVPSPPAPPAPSAKQILVVDDTESVLTTFSDYLHAKGYQVSVARSGQEALNLIRETVPGLILMDVQMPEMDGLETTQRIRAEFPDLPVIAVTALAMPGDRARCLAAGMNDYLSKPVNLKQLVARIERYLH